MKRLACLGLMLLLSVGYFVPKAGAASALPALEEPMNFTAVLKTDMRGPYFELNLAVPDSVKGINANIQGNFNYYQGYSCSPVAIEVEFKYAGYNWNMGSLLSTPVTSLLLKDFLASGRIDYLPFQGSGWTEEQIKAETFYFRVRFAYTYNKLPASLTQKQTSYYSNTAVIKGQGISRRIFGATRRDTAIAVSLEGWPTGANNVILTRDDNYPDALTGTPLSKQLDAPILFTNSKKLTMATEEEIWRLKPENVFILGGGAAVSQDIEDYLSKRFKVTRIGGKDRYDTSKLIALRLGYTSKVMITTGLDYHDALVGAPMAACNQMPVLLTRPNEIPEYTKEALAHIKPGEVIVVGSTQAVSEKVFLELKNPLRICGRDDYETAVLVAEHFQANASRIILVTGNNWPDALAGSGLAAKFMSPTLYVADPLSQPVIDYLSQRKYIKGTEINILGGDAAVPTAVKVAIDRIFK